MRKLREAELTLGQSNDITTGHQTPPSVLSSCRALSQDLDRKTGGRQLAYSPTRPLLMLGGFSDQRRQNIFEVVEARLLPVVAVRNVFVAARAVGVRHGHGHRRHAVSLGELDGLDHLEVRTALEDPRLDRPVRRVDLEVGPAERTLPAIRGDEHLVRRPGRAAGGANSGPATWQPFAEEATVTSSSDRSPRLTAARSRLELINQRFAPLEEYRTADGWVRHKCFISYHSEDAEYAAAFVEAFEDIFIPRAIGVEEEDGSIIDSTDVDYLRDVIRREYLGESTVTIVLVGLCTWARKFIDWEIYASLRDSKNATRNGLLGILLPHAAGEAPPPERLKDNVPVSVDADAYARFKVYPSDSVFLRQWIQEAFDARQSKTSLIINNRPLFEPNRACG